MNKRFLLISLIVSIFFSVANAQMYKSSLGVRTHFYYFPHNSHGLAYKQFLGEKIALEGILAYRVGYVNFHALAEYHIPIITKEFNMYIGAGARVGSLNFSYDMGSFWGLEGIVGFEYKIGKLPFTLSIDWKPFFYKANFRSVLTDEAGFTIRYIF